MRIRTKAQARKARVLAKMKLANKELEVARMANVAAQRDALEAELKAQRLLKQLGVPDFEVAPADSILYGGDMGILISPREARTLVKMHGIEHAKRMGIPDAVIYTDPPDPKDLKTLDVKDWL